VISAPNLWVIFLYKYFVVGKYLSKNFRMSCSQVVIAPLSSASSQSFDRLVKKYPNNHSRLSSSDISDGLMVLHMSINSVKRALQSSDFLLVNWLVFKFTSTLFFISNTTWLAGWNPSDTSSKVMRGWSPMSDLSDEQSLIWIGSCCFVFYFTSRVIVWSICSILFISGSNCWICVLFVCMN